MKYVIDFVNWYIDLHELGTRFKLENKTIIESFKNGNLSHFKYRNL